MRAKRFASFLVAGKLGLAPFVLKASALPKGVKSVPVTEDKVAAFVSSMGLDVSVFTSKELHIVEQPSEGIILQNYFDDSFSSPYDTASAYVQLPGEGCSFQAPSEIKFIITGVRPGEEVFIVASPTKNQDQGLLEQSKGKLKVGLGDLKVLAILEVEGRFSAGGAIPLLPSTLTIEGSREGTVIPIVLNVDLGQLKDGDKFYIQAITFPKGNYDWDLARASELDLIEVNTESCSPYGGTGAPY